MVNCIDFHNCPGSIDRSPSVMGNTYGMASPHVHDSSRHFSTYIKPDFFFSRIWAGDTPMVYPFCIGWMSIVQKQRGATSVTLHSARQFLSQPTESDFPTRLQLTRHLQTRKHRRAPLPPFAQRFVRVIWDPPSGEPYPVWQPTSH